MRDTLVHMFEPMAVTFGWAVRRDWAGGGHEFVALQPTPRAALKALTRDRAYWLRGPLKPRSWDVVLISRNDFELHQGRGLERGRGACRAPDCPTAADDQVRAFHAAR
jgi:hypothetical protein